MGSGKTVTLTMLAIRAFLSGEKIYSNYVLYGIPYIPVHDITQIENMHSGFFAADELWLWMDSRVSASGKNKSISKILLQSRKHGLTVAYTAQGLHQIDKRVRLITDIVMFPRMLDEDLMKVKMYKGCKPIGIPLYFNPIMCYPFYDTTEVVEDVGEDETVARTTYLPVHKNPAWIAYLESRKIWGKNATRICNQLTDEMRIGAKNPS